VSSRIALSTRHPSNLGASLVALARHGVQFGEEFANQKRAAKVMRRYCADVTEPFWC
jgi:hypothetical protein